MKVGYFRIDGDGFNYLVPINMADKFDEMTWDIDEYAMSEAYYREYQTACEDFKDKFFSYKINLFELTEFPIMISENHMDGLKLIEKQISDDDTQKLWDDITEWQDKQFPTSTVETKLKHLKKEVGELLDSPRDHMEYADCFLLLIGAARKAGLDLGAVISTIREKLEINKKRKWGKPNKDGFTEHIKEEIDSD